MLPDPHKFHFEEGGQLVYGNYGGANYSAGEIGGTITPTSTTDDPPLDLFDWLYYQHDLVYQSSSDPWVTLQADFQLATGIYDLMF